MDRKDIDIVVNTLPSHMHVPVTGEFLRKGFHVICVKPLAKTAADVDMLAGEVKKTGRVLTVFQQTHFDPYLGKISEVYELSP